MSLITRSDLETELSKRLIVADNSTLFDSTRLTTLIQNAYLWATQDFIWLELVQGRKANSQAGEEYYDYPSNFKTMSILRLELDDEEYERINFEDYRRYKREFANSDKKMFANWARWYYINPTPTTTGVNNITIWGAEQAAALDNSSDQTIFSTHKVQANMAVVKYAKGIALERIDSTEADKEKKEAKDILEGLNKKDWDNMTRDKRLNHPKFVVPDYFGVSNTSTIGRFGYDS